MTDPDEPTLDDVFTSTEEVHPDRREHAKSPAHLDDDELARRTEEERVQAGLEGLRPGRSAAGHGRLIA